MSLDAADIARIDALLAALGEGAAPVALDKGLKRLLPGVICRHCDAGDVLEDPFRSAGLVDLHLLDASGHCIRVTDNPVEANGLLLAVKPAT